MSGAPYRTARRVPCSTCGAPRHEYCVDAAGAPRMRCHPARAAGAVGVPPMTPDQSRLLRAIAVDESTHLEPGMRRALIARGWIVSLDPRHAAGDLSRRRRRARRHRLTSAGCAAIGLHVAQFGVSAGPMGGPGAGPVRRG